MNKFSVSLRLYLTLVFVVGTAFLNLLNWTFLLIFLVIGIAWVQILKPPWKRLLRIISIEIVFLSLIVLPQGWEKALYLLARSVICLMFINAFILSLPHRSIGSSLNFLPLPAPIKENLYFSVHFLEILLEELRKMKLSASLRGVGEITGYLRYANFAMIGSLYIRSVEKAERIHKAMYLRGYTGTFPLDSNFNFKEKSIISLMGGIIIILIISSYISDF